MKLTIKAAAMAALLSPVMLSTAAHADGHMSHRLTDQAGMTLYTFDKDAGGQSNCYDGCAVKWPPYVAKAGDKLIEGLGVTERKDGTMQWTYKNEPLYTWVGDKKKGDATGDGKGNGTWHIAEKAH
ncbi:hypothetical protein [Marinomonas algarum]|uniref:Lipoprotein with Yx(FWY)xxD motif n=1 Tax=Marinomonas algarum TaxID=2883105 RepID=A0A9X1IKK6_9GAMM|nr:hypothetical protein [Marinomonas algarum]MCB5160592.1 hypothetical protein [Marinomonas algarum]